MAPSNPVLALRGGTGGTVAATRLRQMLAREHRMGLGEGGDAVLGCVRDRRRDGNPAHVHQQAVAEGGLVTDIVELELGLAITQERQSRTE
jgi:hypothetical protein